MPKNKTKKTFLEEIDQTPVMGIVRFLHSGQYSPLVRSMRYALLGLCGDREAEVEARHALQRSKEITDESLFSLDYTRQLIEGRLDKQEWSRRLLPYLQDYAKVGVPFRDFEHEPGPVSQFKKMVNALYHSEEALKIAESLDIEGLSLEQGNTSIEMLSKLGPFVDHVYELCNLITHPDVDLVSPFGDEWRKINHVLFELLAKIPEQYRNQSGLISEQYGIHLGRPKDIAQQLGQWSGSALKHLKPTQEIDYSAVSYFGADLSTHLNRFTKTIQSSANQLFTSTYLNQDRSKLVEYELSEKRLHELDKASLKLASALQSLTSGPQFFQPLKAYKLISIARNIFTLSQSIIEESGHFRAETEELVRKALAELKYELFLELTQTIDKAEEEGLLEPGMRSTATVRVFSEWYDSLFSLVSGFVDLSAKGQDLSRLVDSRFMALREEAFYTRQAEREKSLSQAQAREPLVDEFFALLAQHQGKRLSQLTLSEKNALIERFSVIQPLIAEDDIALSNMIAEALTKQDLVPTPPLVEPSDVSRQVMDGVAYAGRQIYSGLTSVFPALGEYAETARVIMAAHYPDSVEMIDQGYALAVLPVDTVSALLSPKHVYVKVIEGKIALSVKKPNGHFYANVVTPIDAPAAGVPLTVELLKPMEQDILNFARAKKLIRPSLSQRIKQNIRKQEATCEFRAQINKDCRDKIYHGSGGFLQQAYPVKQNVYDRDESKMLHGVGDVEGREVILETIGDIDLLELSKNYLVAQQKFSDAETRLRSFFALLETYDAECMLSDVTQKNQLRSMYMVIQPYLISSLHTLKNEHFSADFDKKIIDAIAGRKTRGVLLPIRDILAVKAEVIGHFSREKVILLRRKEAIHHALNQAVSSERVKELLINNPYGARSGYLVRNPQYTVYMKWFEEKLAAFTTQVFSEEIQKKLIIQERPIDEQRISYYVQFESKLEPFPEANQWKFTEYSQQERQILGLKQFHNCVHHLREIAIQLEELNENSYEIEYVWRVIMIEEHIRRASLLIYQLTKDEHFSVLATDLLRSFDEMKDVFLTLGKPYAPPKADKHSNISEVRDVVFYITNGLVIGREQIDAWQKGQYISKETAKEAQLFAEKTSSKIRRIVEANSYLQWVLQTPTFVTLFYDAKNRWNKFAASSTQAIEANLESIYTENFTKMLIEADEWERKAGLKPGFLSGPLKEMLDAYYFGMAEVLAHDTAHHISLVTTQVPFHKRIEQLHQATTIERQKLTEAENNLESLRRFSTLLEQHPQTIAGLWERSEPQDPEVMQNYQEFTVSWRQLISNQSVNDYLKDKINVALFPVILLQRNSSSPEETQQCQEALKILQQTFVNRLEGDRNTARLSLSHCESQREYLHQELGLQEEKNKGMQRDIIKKLIFEKLVNYQSGEKRLLFVRKPYDDALKEEIESHTEDFLDGIVENQPIEKQVKVFLDEKVKRFDEVHFDEFHQLNELHQSLAELKSYLVSQSAQLTKITSPFRHTWALESADTLKLKLRLYQSLERILQGKKTSIRYEEDDNAPDELEQGEELFDPNDLWHIKARVKRFKEAVEAPRFIHSLLKTEDTFKLSPLSWLVKWFVGLLRILGVYKTEAEVIHGHLKTASAQPKQSAAVILSALDEKYQKKKPASSTQSKIPQALNESNVSVSRVGLFESSKAPSKAASTPEFKPKGSGASGGH